MFARVERGPLQIRFPEAGWWLCGQDRQMTRDSCVTEPSFANERPHGRTRAKAAARQVAAKSPRTFQSHFLSPPSVFHLLLNKNIEPIPVNTPAIRAEQYQHYCLIKL